MHSRLSVVSAVSFLWFVAVGSDVAAGSISLENPSERAIYQRDNANRANVVVAGAYSGDLVKIEARAVVRDGYGGTTTAWQTIDANPSGGKFSAAMPVQGGWYNVEVRGVYSNGTKAESAIQRVGVGDVFITAGQSNSASFGDPRQSPDDDRVSAFNVNNGAWQVADDPQPGANGAAWGIGSGGSPWPQMGDLLAEKTDVPVGIVAVGVGATSVAQWQTDGYYANIKKAIDRLSDTGGFRAILWHQGETDSNLGTTPEQYAAMLNNIIAQSRTDAGFDVPWGVAIASWNPDAPASAIAQVAAGQQLVIDGDPLVFRGAQTNEFHNLGYLSDTVHFNQAGLDAHAQQWVDAILAARLVPVPEPGTARLMSVGAVVLGLCSLQSGWRKRETFRRLLAGKSIAEVFVGLRSAKLATALVCILLASLAQGATPQRITDKTLVVWTSPDTLDQRGGSTLTLEQPGGAFDAIVLGELRPRVWMAGSNGYVRTRQDQSNDATESIDSTEWVQIAIVYRGRQITLYRDGQELASYQISGEPQQFDEDALALLGLRHLTAGDPRFFSGRVDDARIYTSALDANTIASLKPNDASGPRPFAWWTFNDDSPRDHMNSFPSFQLVGGASVEDGHLRLAQGGYLVARRKPVPTRAEEHWPKWHFTARPGEGHCVPYDPNGALYWQGRYHLMYIFQDPSLPAGGHCWGHASSPDMINWTFHPPALVPRPGDPDHGIFSGNAFVSKEGRPMLCWFGIDAGICLAEALDDGLIRWRKLDANPVIRDPQPGERGHGEYRPWDPHIWLAGDEYYCLVGNAHAKEKPPYLLKSRDLLKWEPLHALYDYPDRFLIDGEDCSCPDFFPLGDRQALLCISHTVGARCYLGRYANERFVPEEHVRMNWRGAGMFAPESLLDATGKRVFWAWVIDPRTKGTKDATGSGTMSMPRELSLDGQGHLSIAPLAELASLRENERRIEPSSLPADRDTPLRSTQGDSLELELEIDPAGAGEIGLKLFRSHDGSEETLLVYDRQAKTLRIDMQRSTLRRDVVYSDNPLTMVFQQELRQGEHPVGSLEAPFELLPGETLKLRVFRDGPMLEVFANGRQCLTQQIYTFHRDKTDVVAFAKGGDARLLAATAWDLKPARFSDATTQDSDPEAVLNE